jgi:hypothetical protein
MSPTQAPAHARTRRLWVFRIVVAVSRPVVRVFGPWALRPALAATSWAARRAYIETSEDGRHWRREPIVKRRAA